MTTVRDVVTRALRKIGIVAEGQPPTADQAQSALDALNDMMHGWHVFGVDVDHEDNQPMGLDADFPLAARFVEGTIYQLARRLSPDYSVVGVDDDMFFRALQAAYLVPAEIKLPSGLLTMPSQRRVRWS